MPEPPVEPDARQRLGADISATWPAARELSAGELKARFPKRRLSAGWRLPAAITEPPQDLLVAVDDHFPWSLPHIALPEAPGGVTYPHVEGDGRLCLTNVSDAFDVPVGIAHVQELVQDANDLMQKGKTKSNEVDFFAEAHSYWTLVQPADGQYWLTEPSPSTHAVWVGARDGTNVVLATTKENLERWARHGARRLSAIDVALMLRLNAPLHPHNYPLTMAHLSALATQVGANAELERAMLRWNAHDPLPVVISFDFGGQAIALGGGFLPPSEVKFPGARQRGIPGFRQGSALRGHARVAALSMVPQRFPHAKVVPIYREFLNERTAGPASRALSDMRVVVAGCGAVGGQLAVQLAQAGVGHLTLLDSEALDWRNVGRHVLDGSAVGQNKALAVAAAIKRRFPDIDVTGVAESWETYQRREGEPVTKADLIVSATGEAASNLHLDRLVESGDVPPAVFCFLEAFGVAAHAVFCLPDSGQLRHICTPAGILLEPVADLATMPQAPQEPACGAVYQPFSSLAALSGIALAGELAIDALLGRVAMSQHRVWVGAAAGFATQGLSLTAIWQTRLNATGFARRFDLPMPLMQR
jgi:sulfur-carrier protein adenylyltransferase/sulfurtransferase